MSHTTESSLGNPARPMLQEARAEMLSCRAGHGHMIAARTRGDDLNLSDVIVEKLRGCFDPEIPVNVYDMGLIYGVAVEGRTVTITMTFTSESCPAARDIPADIRRKLLELDAIDKVDFLVVWDPPWHPRMIVPDARRELGLDDDALDLM